MKNRNLANNDNWATPREFYETLHNEFHFDFDPCPLNLIGIIPSKQDGLQIEWGQSNFVNPPYSRALKEAFVKKGIEESKKGKLVVMLLPVSTSTKLFHEHILPNAAEIRFIKGRIKFIGTNTKGENVDDKTPMHDSMVVVFDINRTKTQFLSSSVNVQQEEDIKQYHRNVLSADGTFAISNNGVVFKVGDEVIQRVENKPLPIESFKILKRDNRDRITALITSPYGVQGHIDIDTLYHPGSDSNKLLDEILTNMFMDEYTSETKDDGTETNYNI